MSLHAPTRRELLAGSGVLFAWPFLPKLARAEGRDPRFLTIVLRGAVRRRNRRPRSSSPAGPARRASSGSPAQTVATYPVGFCTRRFPPAGRSRIISGIPTSSAS